MEKPIYQHLTEVTHEYSDTEPVLFILQGNILYLEMGNLGPILCFGVPHRGWPGFVFWYIVYCTVPYHWHLFSQWLTATNKCKIPEFFITSISHLLSLSF